MTEFKIGDRIKLNGKEYDIVGTVKRSWLLQKDGKNYKATSNMMKKIQEQNSLGIGNTPRKREKRSSTHYMQKRVQFSKIFNPLARLPRTENELMKALTVLCGELSPENLTCDGELSRTRVNQKLRELRAEWREIENLLGRNVSESEAENYWLKMHRKEL